MSRSGLYRWLFFALPLAYYLSLPISVGDLAIWVAQGRVMLETGQLLRHDVFSVLPTRDLVYPVGACLLYAWLYALGGWLALRWFHSVVLLAILALLYRATFFDPDRDPANPGDPAWSNGTLAILLLSWLGAAAFCAERPAFLALLPFLVAFIRLDRPPEKNQLAWLCAIEIVWVNLHGSWPLLPVMYAWRELLRADRPFSWKTPARVMAGIGLLLAAALVNPFGYRVFDYVIQTIRLSRERGIGEWSAPLRLDRYIGQELLFYMLLAATGICLWGHWRQARQSGPRRKPMDLARSLLSSPFFPLLLLGLGGLRNTVFAFVALLPASLAPAGATPRDAKSGTSRPVINWLVAAGAAALLVLYFPATYDGSAPFTVTQYLQSTPDREPVFANWLTSGFFALSQAHPIDLDVRNIIYDDTEFAAYRRVLRAQPGWESVLNGARDGVRDDQAWPRAGYVYADPQNEPELFRSLSQSAGWQPVVRSGSGVLFARSGRVPPDTPKK